MFCKSKAGDGDRPIRKRRQEEEEEEEEEEVLLVLRLRGPGSLPCEPRDAETKDGQIVEQVQPGLLVRAPLERWKIKGARCARGSPVSGRGGSGGSSRIIPFSVWPLQPFLPASVT